MDSTFLQQIYQDLDFINKESWNFLRQKGSFKKTKFDKFFYLKFWKFVKNIVPDGWKTFQTYKKTKEEENFEFRFEYDGFCLSMDVVIFRDNNYPYSESKRLWKYGFRPMIVQNLVSFHTKFPESFEYDFDYMNYFRGEGLSMEEIIEAQGFLTIYLIAYKHQWGNRFCINENEFLDYCFENGKNAL